LIHVVHGSIILQYLVYVIDIFYVYLISTQRRPIKMYVFRYKFGNVYISFTVSHYSILNVTCTKVLVVVRHGLLAADAYASFKVYDMEVFGFTILIVFYI